MYERIALIWFSCFCCASENLSSMPASANAAWMSLVLAVRQPDSAPTCAKPTTSSSRAFGPSDSVPVPPLPDAQPARPRISAPAAAIESSFFM